MLVKVKGDLKMWRRILMLAVILLFAVVGFSDLTFAKTSKKKKFDPEVLADKIVVGLLSEEEFSKMELTDEQKLEVFKRIKEKRGWQIDDEELAAILNEGDRVKSLAGSCDQKVEMEYGSIDSTYPARQTSPNEGECGGEGDDIILEYNILWGTYTDPSKVRWWHPLWYDRWVIGVCYNWRGGLAARGLCTRSTRVCIGSCAKKLGNELNYLYLWHTK